MKYLYMLALVLALGMWTVGCNDSGKTEGGESQAETDSGTDGEEGDAGDEDAGGESEDGDEGSDEAEGDGEESASAAKQTLCPVSGHKIDLASHVEHDGKKVYFCCDGCIEKFEADTDKYLAMLPQFGGSEDKIKAEGS